MGNGFDWKAGQLHLSSASKKKNTSYNHFICPGFQSNNWKINRNLHLMHTVSCEKSNRIWIAYLTKLLHSFCCWCNGKAKISTKLFIFCATGRLLYFSMYFFLNNNNSSKPTLAPRFIHNNSRIVDHFSQRVRLVKDTSDKKYDQRQIMQKNLMTRVQFSCAMDCVIPRNDVRPPQPDLRNLRADYTEKSDSPLSSAWFREI